MQTLFSQANRIACSLALVGALAASARALDVDPQFHSPVLIDDTAPYRVGTRADGSFFVSRNFNRFNSEDRGPLLKFRADRTLDQTFRMAGRYFQVNAFAFAPDGDVFVAARQVDRQGPFYPILRLNPDGSVDPSFNSGRGTNPQVEAIALQPDEKVLIAGSFTRFAGEDRPGILRLNAEDGSIDTSFGVVTASGRILSNIVLQPDGKILVAGDFDSVNGTPRNTVVRLNADGTVDTTFAQPPLRSSSGGLRPVRTLALQPDGKILMGGKFVGPNNTISPLVRVNADGSLDQIFPGRPVSGSQPRPEIYSLALLANGDIVGAGDRLYRFTSIGAVVAGFENIPLFANPFGSLAAEADGSVLVARGAGTTPDLVRFSNTGAREDLELGVFGIEELPGQIAPRFDGEIWVDTEFANLVDGTARGGVVRLKPDGGLNLQLAASITGGGFALESDGKILLFDYRAALSETPNDYFRLNADDSLDSTFQEDSRYLEFNGAIAVSGGKYLILNTLSPRAILNDIVIRRLLSNGLLDESFSFAIKFNQAASNGYDIYAGDNRPLAFYSDGRFLMRYFDRTGEYHLRRFTGDGALDESFIEGRVPAIQTTSALELVSRNLTGEQFNVIRAPGTHLTDAALLPDGRVVVTGMFNRYSGAPAPGIARLLPNGSVDSSFKPGAGAQWLTAQPDARHIPRVDAVEVLDDGKLLITGDFEAFDGKASPGIARLNADGTCDDTFVGPVALQSQYSGFPRTAEDSLPVSQLVPDGKGAAFLSGNFALPGSDVVRSLIRLTGFPKNVPLNISTRLNVQTGENVMIGGFIITGSAPKKVIVRALGTSLTQAGIAGALADPTLELQSADAVIARNDNWKESQQSEIQASGVPPQNELESAIIRTLAPGAYTAIVRGKNGGTGVGLVELYDLDQAADSRLANISTRGFVQTGENVMIGGFILGGGGGPTNVLVRAVGPSLGDSGVAGALGDPTLELRDSAGNLVAENDDWKSAQEAAIQSTTIPPKRDEEAAILAALRPGPYTAIVRGKNNGTGVGLVEVYNVQ